MNTLLNIHNGERIRRDRIPVLNIQAFRQAIITGVRDRGARLVALFGSPSPGASVPVHAVLASPASGSLSVAATEIRESYPSLTPDCPQAQGFERELAEQWNIRPEGHPWLKPIRFHAPLRDDAADGSRPPGRIGETNFYGMDGEEIHEVAVGPVHAGIIEPGHFRFQCHGENVFHLEISLGYQHRGIEHRLLRGPDSRTVHYMETAAGDTTIGHTLAYASLVEALAGSRVSARAHAVRAIALELERLANHTGDLGALANDIGYLPTASYCGRLRGDFLNMTALLCGSRFGRGLVRAGGVQFDLDAERIKTLQRNLDLAERDVREAVELLWSSPSVMARFEGTGSLTRQQAVELGLLGPAARACGVETDTRLEFPLGMYCFTQIPISTLATGDVFGRAYVRWMEIGRSIHFVRELLGALPGGALGQPHGPLAPDSMAVALVEGWRGQVAHVALTDSRGRFHRYKIVDPSFLNWFGLAMAMRDQQISDFPLCNKSFNLSYCGHDL